MDYGIFNVRTDVNVCDCTRGCTDTVRESTLKVVSGRKKSLAAPGNRTCVGSVPVRCCTNWATSPRLCPAVLPQSLMAWAVLKNTTRLIQRPRYQQGSPCRDAAGNRTTRRPDHRKETQCETVWTCLPFIRSGQNHFARHSERGKKTRQTEEVVGRQHEPMDKP